MSEARRLRRKMQRKGKNVPNFDMYKVYIREYMKGSKKEPILSYNEWIEAINKGQEEKIYEFDIEGVEEGTVIVANQNGIMNEYVCLGGNKYKPFKRK
jgi:hypothetical protein